MLGQRLRRRPKFGQGAFPSGGGLLSNTRHWPNVFICWPTVFDVGPTSKQHWVNDSCLLAYCHGIRSFCSLTCVHTTDNYDAATGVTLSPGVTGLSPVVTESSPPHQGPTSHAKWWHVLTTSLLVQGSQRVAPPQRCHPQPLKLS